MQSSEADPNHFKAFQNCELGKILKNALVYISKPTTITKREEIPLP
jgi:hypothetical protein